MVLVESVVFANTKGGCGKSTLLFQISSAYARDHPDHKVVILDATQMGDCSISFLGGSAKTPGADGVEMPKGEWFTQDLGARNFGTFSKLLDSSLNSLKPSGWLTGLFAAAASRPAADLNSKLVQVSSINEMIPSNVYLACGGNNRIPLTDSERIRIVKTLRKAFEEDTDEWAIFADTDGDLSFSQYTKVCLGLCPKIVLPYEIDPTDLLRFSHLFVPQLRQMKEAKEFDGDIALVIWNKVSVKTWKNRGVISRVFESPKEKENEMIELQKRLSEWLQGSPDSWKDCRSAVVPPFDQDGILARRSGRPFFAMEKLGKPELLVVIEDILDQLNKVPLSVRSMPQL